MNLQYLLDKYKIKADINMLLEMWNSKNRHYHNLNHLNDLISQIDRDLENDTSSMSENIYEKLVLTALFHDIIYESTQNDNEERSAELFLSMCVEKNNSDIVDIYNAILDTKKHDGNTTLSERFNRYDMGILESDYERMLSWEEGIFEEYRVFGNETYKDGRLKFLNSMLDKYPKNTDNLLKLIDYVKSSY